MHITVHTDGGTRSNPGPGAWGAVIHGLGELPHEISGFLPMTTNNAAEYRALEYACDYVLAELIENKGPHTVDFFLDSKLVVEQISYKWAVRDPELYKFYRSARDKYSRLEAYATVTIQHVRREFNKEADALCNIVMDEHGVVCERKAKETA